MEGLETTSLDALSEPRSRPRTLAVLGLLAGVALIFSYLVAYAMANALATAEVIPRWLPDRDPRPRWFATTFVGLMGGFVLIGAFFRFASRRQLRKLDEMEDAPEDAGA